MIYQFIIIPIIASVFTQFFAKLIISKLRGSFSWKNLFAYGGMPSAHSALVSSLATSIAITKGINSVEFAISFFFALIVIVDAMGLRGHITEQSKTINKLIIDLPDELEYKYRELNERVAHTPLQVIVGSLIGIIIAFIFLI